MDLRIKSLSDTPHTISYVIRKRQQIDSLSELGKEKMPTNEIIWDGSPEDLEEWIERVLSPSKSDTGTVISLSDVED